ncbi:MAG: DUF262 domain-containing HNH endonuclease family protein [Candidatus Paceibacterota bacterium]
MPGAGKIEDAKTIKFGQLFTSEERYALPYFQRPYEWKTKHIADLLESIVEYDPELFIGVIVLLQKDEDPDGRYKVIDGQQRLTTLCLLLAAIRDQAKSLKIADAFKESYDDMLKRIEDSLIYRTKLPPIEKTLRLKPYKESLENVFSTLLHTPSGDGIDKNLYDENQKTYVSAYLSLLRLVRDHANRKKLGDEEAFKRLCDLETRINTLVFIRIMCESESDANGLFEGLNTTGLGLSVADMLKNAVLGAAAQQTKDLNLRSNIESRWDSLENLFETTKMNLFTTFLRHQWIAQTGELIPKSRLYDAISKSKIKKKSFIEIDNFSKELLSDAEIYTAMRAEAYINLLKAPGRKLSKTMLRAIETFRLLDVDQPYAVLLALLKKKYANKNYTDTQLERDINLLLRFSIRAKFTTISPSAYEKTFAGLCQHVASYKKKEMNRMTVDHFNKLFKKVENDDDFKSTLIAELKYKKNGDNRLLHFVFSEIFSHEDPSIMHAKPNLEHIIPREPSLWGLSIADVQDYLNNIGNLTLLDEETNKRIGNKPMKEKVEKAFAVSPFRTNKALAKRINDFQLNPEETVEKRSYELAEIANIIWPGKA